jgi:hypothetical protein
MDFRPAIAAAIAAAILFGAMVAVGGAGVGGLGCCTAALACNGVALSLGQALNQHLEG